MTARKRTRRPADVAWGFFYDALGGRCIVTGWTRNEARQQRRGYRDALPGPIFCITPPAEIRKPRKKVKHGR